MKLNVNGKHSYFLTFFVNFILLDWIWKNLELSLYGELRPSLEDSIILLIFCLLVTFANVRKENAE